MKRYHDSIGKSSMKKPGNEDGVSLARQTLRVRFVLTKLEKRTLGTTLTLMGLGHAILGNFSIDQMVIELTEITK